MAPFGSCCRSAVAGREPDPPRAAGGGESHLAIALGMEAVCRRLQVEFTIAARMIASLSEARSAGTFLRRLGSYVRPSLLIVDELGFLPLGPDEAALMFEVVGRHYERGSIVLASNKSHGAWAESSPATR